MVSVPELSRSPAEVVPVEVMSPPAIVTPVGLMICIPSIVRAPGISGPVVTGACDCA